ncbi:MAG: hypothetical protein Q8K36_01370, partial [Alphaproteobacteria bacterium]|nr:hypothetical protein [Alphaproteobacteria bacterium]
MDYKQAEAAIAAKIYAVESRGDEAPSTPVAPPPPEAAAAVDEKESSSNSYQVLAVQELRDRINQFAKPQCRLPVTRTVRFNALKSAAINYAQALLNNKIVPKEDMKVLRTARTDIMDTAGFSEREQVRNTIMNHLRAPGSDFIHLQNPIPPFLNDRVYDKTSDVHAIIDGMRLNSHIEHHLKNSIGYYYEAIPLPGEAAGRSFDSNLEEITNKVVSMAAEYMLLDDALIALEHAPEALKGKKYIVIPDVGATDEAITSRIEDLDRLFEAHPELTLVIAFKDDVKKVGDWFCGRKGLSQPHKFPTKVQKVSFSGKNLTKIGAWFFWGCPFIQAVDFRGLRSLESVGCSFFMCAYTLTTLDLRGLTAFVNIGNHFFSSAKSMQFLDTRGLSAVE